MNKLRIVIIDDHDIFREGIKMVLNQIPHFEVVFDTDNAHNFLSKLAELQTDVVLMDYNMPAINGDEAVKKALKIQPGLNIIALTMFSDLMHYTKMINAGVKGFVVKKASKSELQTAIETVYYGGNYFSKEILQQLALQSMHNEKLFQKLLTGREKEILQLICRGKTTEEIGKQLFISIKTVETHRNHIFKKAGVRNIAELIIWAVKNNYFSIT